MEDLAELTKELTLILSATLRRDELLGALRARPRPLLFCKTDGQVLHGLFAQLTSGHVLLALFSSIRPGDQAVELLHGFVKSIDLVVSPSQLIHGLVKHGTIGEIQDTLVSLDGLLQLIRIVEIQFA